MDLGLRNFKKYMGNWEKQFSAAQELECAFLQIDGIPANEETEVARWIDKTGVGIASITALNTCMLGPDMAKSAEEQGKIKATIDQASRLNVPLVSVFAGNDWNRSFEENIDTFREVYEPLAAHAESREITLVVENCPMGGGTRPVKNLAYCPRNWRAMFEAVPSPALAIELDFGHLPGLGIDPLRAIDELKGRIGHVGMKDARIDSEALFQQGYIGGFAHHVLPGQGVTDFEPVLRKLIEAGYKGPFTLDHVAPDDDVEKFRPAAELIRGLLDRIG